MRWLKIVTLLSVTGSAAFAQGAPFDLVWNAEDDNRLPLNPKWRAQTIAPFAPPDPGSCALQGAWVAPCTSQFTRVNATVGKGCSGLGHANWRVVTYDGTLIWADHATDDDYCFYLQRTDKAGMTANNGDGLSIEFDSDETIDHFDTPWWNLFHSVVDSGTPHRNPSGYVNGRFAIVIGLMGLDFVHNSGQAELHPVYAMAIRTDERYYDGDWPFDEEESWAFFVRNWGNEGWCSSGMEETPQRQFTFRLPWVRKRTASVDLANAVVKCRGQAIEEGPTWAWESRPADRASLLTVTLREPRARDVVHGEMHLLLHPERDDPAAPIPAPDGRRVDAEKEARAKREARAHSNAWEQFQTTVEKRAKRSPREPEERLAKLIQGLPGDKRKIFERVWHKPSPAPHLSLARKLDGNPRIDQHVGTSESVPDPALAQRMRRRMAILREFFGSDYETKLSSQK